MTLKALTLRSLAPQALTLPGALLGEGPCWDAATATLWWVDILGERLHAWNGEARHWDLPLMASLAAPRGDGTLTLVTEAGIAAFDPADGSVSDFLSIEHGRPGNRSNDSKVSPGGHLLASSMGRAAEPGVGGLYAVSPNGEIRTLLEGLTIPNGLAWSLDGRWIYFADSARRQVYRAAWDEAAGTIGTLEPYFKPESPAAPDGAATDSAGTYWVALWGGHRVVGVNPEGRIIAEIALPVAQPTACAFGGSDGKTLFITSAADGDSSPLAGALFALQMAVPGAPVPPFIWNPP